MADIQLLGNLGHVDRLALEGEGGVAGDDGERGRLRQVGDDVLGDAVAEVFLLRIAAHVGEGQHGDRELWCWGRSARCFARRWNSNAGHPVDPHRLRHVLQVLLAQILEAELDLAPDMAEHRLGHQNAARLGQGFQSRRDVDAIAVEVAALHHDIAEVHPDAQHDLPILGYAFVGGGHGFLQLDGALDGIDCAGELDQHPVAHQLDDAAVMLGDCRLKNLSTPGLERSQGAGLIRLA